MNTIAVALISGASAVTVGILSLIGVILSGDKTNRDVQSALTTAQAVTDTKLEALANEVREQNDLTCRIPIIEEQLRMAGRRIGNLENASRRIPPC